MARVFTCIAASLLLSHAAGALGLEDVVATARSLQARAWLPSTYEARVVYVSGTGSYDITIYHDGSPTFSETTSTGTYISYDIVAEHQQQFAVWIWPDGTADYKIEVYYPNGTPYGTYLVGPGGYAAVTITNDVWVLGPDPSGSGDCMPREGGAAGVLAILLATGCAIMTLRRRRGSAAMQVVDG